MPHSFRTSRLLLRPILLRDATPVWRVFNTPDYTRMTGTWRHPFTREEMARRIRASDAKDDQRFWFVALAGDAVVGQGLLFGRDETSIELGYAVGGEHAGQGFATEIGTVLCDFALRGLRAACVRALVSTDNPASCRVLEKIGFVRHGGIGLAPSAHYGRDTPVQGFVLTRERFAR